MEFYPSEKLLFKQPHSSDTPRNLERAAAEAPTDDSVSIAVPTLMEVYEAIKKLKARKLPGVCGIHPEFI